MRQQEGHNLEEETKTTSLTYMVIYKGIPQDLYDFKMSPNEKTFILIDLEEAKKLKAKVEKFYENVSWKCDEDVGIVGLLPIDNN